MYLYYIVDWLWIKIMNVNGNCKDCSTCEAKEELGINKLGMQLYGCRYKTDDCKAGKPILEELKFARMKMEGEANDTGK